MSSKQLFTRGNHYYHRQWIPLDLRPLYGDRVELVRSLKTSNKKQAQSLASGLHQKYTVTFSLLRSGIVPDDLVTSLVADSLPTQRKAVQSKDVISTPPPSLPLSSLIDLYTKEYATGWTEKSKLEFAGQFRLLVMILGDKPVASFDRASCLECRETLMKIPPGFTRKKDLKNLPLPSLVSLGLPGLSAKTVNKHMVLLSSLFKWATTHGHMERNHAEGLSLEIHKRADEERKPYDKEDLQRIMVNLPSDDPARKWVPRIAMYSGMRLEEVSQMTKEDIKPVDGVLCFHVHDGGERQVKTKASVRIVPVHPALMEMGLMEYVERQPSEANLWGLKRGKWGYGKNVSNWWTSYFNRQYVTTDPLKCFHSLRHTFANTLKQMDVQESMISELMGHANDSITTGRYGKRYQPKVLLEVVSRIDYGHWGLDDEEKHTPSA